jgi:CheY-like chemotaxis protein
MDGSTRLLIVDDSEDDAEILVMDLENNDFNLVWSQVDNKEDLAKILKESKWDIVVCDVNMPRFDPIQALEIVNEIEGDLPVIIVSGTVHEDNAFRFFKAGARDFLPKDNLARLPMVIRREILEHQSRLAKCRIEQQIVQMEQEENLKNFSSFQAGIADMGVSMQHNIGNTVMSIMNYADLIKNGSSELEGVAKILARFDSIVDMKLKSGQTPENVLEKIQEIFTDISNDMQSLSTDVFKKNAVNIHDGLKKIADIVKVQGRAGHIELQKKQFDMRKMVGDILFLLDVEIKKQGIHIDVSVDKRLNKSYLPHDHLFQMVVNLVKNSIEAISTRAENETFSGLIDILLCPCLSCGKLHQISHGLSCSFLKHIFE